MAHRAHRPFGHAVHNGYTVHVVHISYTAPVARSRSRRWVELDHRGRIAVGQFARHSMYLLTVDEKNIITLTPADVVAVAPAPIKPRTPRKRPAKKAAPAAAEPQQKQE